MPYINHTLDAFTKNRGKTDKIKIGFLGLGKTNLAIIDYLKDTKNVKIILRDTRYSVHVPEALPYTCCYFGNHAYENIDEDILFLSPSVSRAHPELADTAMRGTYVTSDCDEFFKFTDAKIFAVTGSDGKSTVTALASSILNESGIQAQAIGNIGTPFISATKKEAYVTELSSFSLENLTPKSFAAAITNITPNHLDFHKSFENYRCAKLNVLKNTERAVLCFDDSESKSIISKTSPYAVFSVEKNARELKELTRAEHFYTLENSALCIDGEEIVPIHSIPRRERHNLQNMLCAMALCGSFATNEAIYSVLSSFHGLEHRCELIHTYKGIEFYNSSIDTTPTRTAQTLNSLNKRVKLILGGRGKGLSLEPLRAPLLKYASSIAIYGEEKENLIFWLEGDRELKKIPKKAFEAFDDAYDYLTDGLTDGDIVLLSPAFTAYGEFPSFEYRGQRFRELVKEKFGAKQPKI